MLEEVQASFCCEFSGAKGRHALEARPEQIALSARFDGSSVTRAMSLPVFIGDFASIDIEQ